MKQKERFTHRKLLNYLFRELHKIGYSKNAVIQTLHFGRGRVYNEMLKKGFVPSMTLSGFSVY